MHKKMHFAFILKPNHYFIFITIRLAYMYMYNRTQVYMY